MQRFANIKLFANENIRGKGSEVLPRTAAMAGAVPASSAVREGQLFLFFNRIKAAAKDRGDA